MTNPAKPSKRALETDLAAANMEIHSLRLHYTKASEQVVEAYKALEKAMNTGDGHCPQCGSEDVSDDNAEFNSAVEDVKDRLLHWLEGNHADYIRDPQDKD